MPATVADLLEQAQQQAWDMARTLARPAPDDTAVAADRHLAGWARLAAAGRRALAPGPVIGPQMGTSMLTAELQRLIRRSREPGVADPALGRIADLLGAVADLVGGEPRTPRVQTQHVVGYQDKVTAVLQTAARVSCVVLEQDRRPQARRQARALAAIAQAAQQSIRTRPTERAGRLDEVAAVSSGEPGLLAAVTRWAHVANLTLDPTLARASARSVSAIPGDLALICYVTAVTVRSAELTETDPSRHLVEALQESSASWAGAGQAWPHFVHAGGQSLLEQSTASAALRGQLRNTMTQLDPYTATVPPPATLAQARRTILVAERIGSRYLTSLQDLLESNALIAPARALARLTRPVPLDVAHAARQGQWRRLTAEHPISHELRYRGVQALRQLQMATQDQPSQPSPGDTSLSAIPTNLHGPAHGTDPSPAQRANRRGPTKPAPSPTP